MTLLVETVSGLATLSLIAMDLEPATTVYAIAKTKKTGVTPVAPLVSLGTNSWIWTMYGFLGHNIFPVAVGNLTGTVFAVAYTAVFYRYTHDRANARKVVGFFLLVAAVATGYAVVGVLGYMGQPREQVQNVLGYVGVATMLVFFSSNFENIALVFRHGSAKYIPIHLVAAGAVNNALWVCYSLLTSDWFIFVPNFGSFLIASVQIVLYFVFKQPNKRDAASVEITPVWDDATSSKPVYGAIHA